MPKTRYTKLLSIFACSLGLTGCINPGPRFLESDNLSYNRAWNTALSNQLLLNIVRDQYHEPQLYMVADNISSSGSYTPPAIGDISSASSVFRYHWLRDLGGASITVPNISFSPSFSYSPQTNGKFMIESLLPLKPKTLFYVIKTESTFGDIFRMTVQRMGPYVNFAYHSKNNQERRNTKSIQNFIKLTRALDDVYEQNGHQLYMTELSDSEKFKAEHHSKNALTLIIPHDLQISHQDWQMLKTIGVTHTTKAIYFSNSISDPAKHIIRFSLRSLLGLTDFLAQGVDRVPNRRYRRLDQPLMTNGLFEVHWTTSYPRNAYLRVKDHNLWYYVKRGDFKTKVVFRLYRIFNDITQADNRQTSLLIQT